MKTISPLLLALGLSSLVSQGADQIVTLGDSLTFAYESEFGTQMTVPGFGTVGEGAPATVRNWIETLSSPTYRFNNFDLGSRIELTISGATPPNFLLRQQGNFAIPGLKVDGMRQFVMGERTFAQLVGADVFPPVTPMGRLVNASDYTEADFSKADFDTQVTSTAERLVISIGGNDIDDIYGSIYNGGPAGTFVADFVADMTAVIDRVQLLNPNIQIVLANVPHVGITPKVRGSYPYDLVKTERVSALMRDLNGQLFALANAKKIGYADIYSPTLPMLDPNKDLPVLGQTFTNGSTGANGTYGQGLVWLNGSVSSNFHPNTNAQSQIANAVVHAFNVRYNAGIKPLTTTEVLINLGGKGVNAPERTFTQWKNAYGVTGTAASDPDGDGVSMAVEFATGLSPLYNDADYLSTRVSGGSLQLAFPTRLASSPNFTIVPEYSTTLAGAFTPMALPTEDADGLRRAVLPLGSNPGFLRLKVVIP